MDLIPESLSRVFGGSSSATGGSKSTTSSERRDTGDSSETRRDSSTSETTFERKPATGSSLLSGAFRTAAMSVPPVAMAKATMDGLSSVADTVRDALTDDEGESTRSTARNAAAPAEAASATATGRYSDARAGASETVHAEHGGHAEAADAPDAGRTQHDMRRGAHQGELSRSVMMLNAQRMLLQGATFVKDVHPLNNRFTGEFFEGMLNKANVNPETHLESTAKDLEREQTLKLMLDVTHALGASHDTMEALDGTYDIEIVPDEELGSDAAYDPETKKILVSESLIDRTQENMDQLREEGAIHTTFSAAMSRALSPPIITPAASANSVRDAEKLDTSEAADEVLKVATLLIHEAEHAEQDQRGEIAQADVQLEQMREELLGEVAYMHPADQELAVARVDDQVELVRIDAQEYDAYHVQEVKQFELGAVTKTRVTIDDSGNPLPREQAVANIFALQKGLPMVYGPSAPAPGAQMSGVPVTHDAPPPPHAHGAAGHDHGGAPGRRIPGEDVTGRRIPGDDIYGRRIPGEDLNGRRIPGEELYGRRIPGDELNGRRIPGDELAGRRIPGDELNGRRIPGSMIGDPAEQAPDAAHSSAPAVASGHSGCSS